jgi:uncharacterized membrane protein
LGFRKHWETILKEDAMSVIDEIRQAVAGSTKLESGVKTVLGDFLEIAEPALETLGPSVVKEIMGSFATGDGATAVGAVADGMTEGEVVAALGGVEQEMSAEVTQRSAEVAASRATMAAVQSAAVSVLARLLISAL